MSSQLATPKHRLAMLSLTATLLLAACGTSATPTVGPPTPAPATALPATAAPALSPSGAATPSGGPAATPLPQYYHADDYSVLAGQLAQRGACWVLTYVSPMVDIPPDPYNNEVALLPGAGWDAATLKEGAWMVAHGRLAPAGVAVPGCAAQAYEVSVLSPNP